ncbi:MAG: FmdB family transcriptional regulator [Candidatus Omnitrophica bacterium CG07_land_8_20_14_0_80_42_15]|uniref:FmdB family transcriptional regulator n=1 Tax=Candidatus Aquitaenariimonas noxiae TaxID=1974741 RepID=A0A2J0KRD3_9BACT|nr:MAG: FmdB family transcriptional regulator [Candidatus Omnitrophica bacterium CG07_land_8_20_14_0_80_42_15]
MPTYDYKCQKCAHVFEIFQSMKAARIEKCPKCGGKVKRLIGSGAGIIFKGTGFYATDYKKSDTKGKKGEPSDACKKCRDDTCKRKREN